jgi:hypothetical protein
MRLWIDRCDRLGWDPIKHAPNGILCEECFFEAVWDLVWATDGRVSL